MKALVRVSCLLLAVLGVPSIASAGTKPSTPASAEPAAPLPTQVQCSDCPPSRLADAQKALDDGLRIYQRGLAIDNARLLADAVVLFRHGYAQSADPIFLIHQANIDRRQGTCGEAMRSYKDFVRAEAKLHRFPAEAKRMSAEFAAFAKECAWQGTSAPKVVEKRLVDFAKAQAGKLLKVKRTATDSPLRIHCPLNAKCDEKADYRMLMGSDPGLRTQVVFDPSIVGREATADLMAAFRYADFNVFFPELSSTTWKVSGDSFKFLMRQGDPRIRTIAYKDGLLHIHAVAEITELQAFSIVDKCMVSNHPKACILRVPAAFPLELELLVPMEVGPLDCKDKKMVGYGERCG